LKEIVWGSLGCGNVMEVKSGPALQNVEHSQLHAVMRRNGSLAKDFATRHKVPKWYAHAEELVHDSKVNAIYIATPPNTHLSYTKLAASAGKPVYVEKPMANSHGECLEMIKVCEDNKVPLFVAYYRRALPRFLKVKSILDSGILGTIQEVNIQLLYKAKSIDIEGQYNWRVIPEIAGCGYFCDLGSHIIDLLQFFLGDIRTATGTLHKPGKYYQAEDRVEAHLEFENGVIGRGLWDFDAGENFDRTEIIGSAGSVSYTHFSEANVSFKTKSGLDNFEIPNPLHIQQPLVQLMVNELRGVGICPSNGVSAARTNWVMDQILGRGDL